jgi:hypothetical protein
MSNLYYEKYTKYKNKYLNIKQLGGVKHNDEYTACEIENKLLKKPSKVLIYTLQFPTFLEGEDEYSYTSDDGIINVKNINDLQKLLTDFYMLKTSGELLHIIPPSTYMDDLVTPEYTYNFSEKANENSVQLLNRKKLEVPDYKGKIIMLRNGTFGYALSCVDLTNNQIVHYKLSKDEDSYKTDDSTAIKNIKDLQKLLKDFYIIKTDGYLLHIVPPPNYMDNLLTPEYIVEIIKIVV